MGIHQRFLWAFSSSLCVCLPEANSQTNIGTTQSSSILEWEFWNQLEINHPMLAWVAPWLCKPSDSQIHQRHFRIQMASSSTDSRDPLQSSRRVFCPPAMERNIPNMWTKKRVHCGYELKLNVSWNMDIDFTCKLNYISRSWLFLHWIETLKLGYVWLAASLCCLSDVVSLDIISIWNSPLVEVFYDFAKQKTKTCIGG